MSVQSMSWAYRCHVGNAAAKAVLVYLADRADDDGTGAWPAVATICRVTEFSEATVRRALAHLEGHGFIRRGDQRHAALAPKGRTRPRQYRSVVWDLAVDTEPERLAAWLESTHHAEHEADGATSATGPHGEGAGTDGSEPRRADSGGVTVIPPEEDQGSHCDTSRGLTVIPLLEPSVNHQSPPHGSPVREPRGENVHENTDRMGDGAHRLLDRMAGLRADRGLPARGVVGAGPTGRELAAARRLLDEHGERSVIDTAAWALDDGFWRSNALTARALERNWTQISLQRARPARPGMQPEPPARDPHRAIMVAAGTGRGKVWGAAVLRVDQSQAHLLGEVPSDECPLCAYDGRNRDLHGSLRARDPKPEKGPERRRTAGGHHFVGLTRSGEAVS